MLVIATSTVLVIVIVIAAVAVLAGIFLAIGPLSSREQLRDDYGAEVGAMGVPALKAEPERELDPDNTWAGPDAEANLDRRFE
jgi:hypothetical protein